MGTNERLSSAHKKREEEEKDFREARTFVFLYHHTITFANSTGERASHRRRERGLNRAKTRSTRAVWRRRERFRGRKIINHIRLLGIFRRDDDDINQCAIESTYNNRNRKRLLKNGVETNHERACGLTKRSANLVLGWPAVGGRHIPLGRDHHRPSRKSLPRRLVLRRDPLPSRLPV